MPVDSGTAAIWVAVTTAVASPWILARQQASIRRKEKQEDYARQDEVAKRALESDQRLLAKTNEVAVQAKEAARLLVESNKQQAKQAEKTDSKLNQVHTLVNSNLTAAKQDQLDTLRLLLANTEVLAASQRKEGVSPEILLKTTQTIEETKKKIGLLATELIERMQQTDNASAQLAVDMQRREAPGGGG